MRGGAAVGDHCARIAALDEALAAGGDELALIRSNLSEELGALRTATDWLLEHGLSDPLNALAGATPYLRLFSVVSGGWMRARPTSAATAALQDVGDADKALPEDKVVSASFYVEQLLTHATDPLPPPTP